MKGMTAQRHSKATWIVILVSLFSRTSWALVTGKIQVQAAPARGWVRYSDGDDMTSDSSSVSSQSISAVTGYMDNSIVIHNKPGGWNVTRRSSGRRSSLQSISDFECIEEKSKRELEWIVRNTEKILGPESPTVGNMSRGMIKLVRDLMSAWSRRASKREGSKAPHVVERLLQRLIQERDAGNEFVFIDTSLYNRVLEAWANSSEEGSAERCEEILLRLEKMYLEDGNDSVKPNESSYNAVIKAYVKNGNRHISATKVEALIKRMEEQMDILGVAPTRRSYNLLLYAFANSKLKNAAEHSEEVLHKMYHRYVEEGDERCKPDINSYNQCLAAWARGTSHGFEHRMQAIYQELLTLPDDMEIRPNADTFNAVMGGWLKSDNPSSLEMIQGVLYTMENAYARGNAGAKPDRITINTITAAYVKNGTEESLEKSMEQAAYLERKYQVMPNTVSHNIIVDSWCKSGREDAPDQVMDLLITMEKAFRKGKRNMKPDGYTYSSIIGCFIKFQRQDAAEVAEELLQRMQDLYRNYGGDPPATSVFNALINAWASHSDAEKGMRRVKELLKLMEENDGGDKAIPKANRITYNTVIKASRNCPGESLEYVDELLIQLEERGRSEPLMLPDSYSYTSAITAFARSDFPDKAHRAFGTLERMLVAVQEGNMAATPTTHSYNAVLNACAFTNGDDDARRQAFDIATKTYEMLKTKGTPDHTTYGTLLRICATLLPEKSERESLVDEIFRKACATGNVGSMVIAQLRFASTPNQHIRLTGREIVERINVKDFPKSWTRNVRERRGE